jgi:hypothetical protein
MADHRIQLGLTTRIDHPRRPDRPTDCEAPCVEGSNSAHQDGGGTTKSLPRNSV